MANVDTNVATHAAANTIAWRLRGFEVERIDETCLGVVVQGDDALLVPPPTTITVLDADEDVWAASTNNGYCRWRSLKIRLRNRGVDADVHIVVDKGKWFPMLGNINPRTGGISAVLKALEAIGPILKTLAR